MRNHHGSSGSGWPVPIAAGEVEVSPNKERLIEVGSAIVRMVERVPTTALISNPISLLVLGFIDLSLKSTDLSTKSTGLPVEIGFCTCRI
jgi:hypothetical protein